MIPASPVERPPAPTRTARRKLILALGAAAVWSPSRAASPVVLPAAVSLAQELAAALRVGKPLLVMVSLEGCVFCRAVRESHLAPMREQQGLQVVQVDMRSRQTVRDFKGVETTHDQLVRSWGVKIAPTVLFLGADGAELAPRMVGSYLPDFYGAYLDERLALAQARLRM